MELRVISERHDRASLCSPEDGEPCGAKCRRCDWTGKIKYEDELRVDAERGAAFNVNGGKRSRATV